MSEQERAALQRTIINAVAISTCINIALILVNIWSLKATLEARIELLERQNHHLTQTVNIGSDKSAMVEKLARERIEKDAGLHSTVQRHDSGDRSSGR